MSKLIIGIDEVGRGSLAGPVAVTALIMPKNLRVRSEKLPKLRDSKHLSVNQRNKIYDYLRAHPKISYVTARALPKTIDRINISRAANEAATRAFNKLVISQRLNVKSLKVYLDGGLYVKRNFQLGTCNFRTLIRGDLKINAIKLASIAAKVTRDRYMVKLHKKYPKYGFDVHKGYGTKKHLRAIKKYGPCEVHRLTFV